MLPVEKVQTLQKISIIIKVNPLTFAFRGHFNEINKSIYLGGEVPLKKAKADDILLEVKLKDVGKVCDFKQAIFKVNSDIATCVYIGKIRKK